MKTYLATFLNVVSKTCYSVQFIELICRSLLMANWQSFGHCAACCNM